ncbi:unnamed protein product [Didymodactylos carnosus]|uniref:Uncharacterized protein n=1 Tax=Didymodactylos carnosus TaxID=1234261 RepID=A0A815F0Q3_9BILA|nr:unnamed protein product [Didymodactylos carnosus]CAF1321968.1 unnamed protein product [Didymodactylos carnosus]CAF3730221.1 unnamed protein product [Didymodactylos carnosus]CAF4168521.1 unnamed protein product [Didymodactylos carnosus]
MKNLVIAQLLDFHCCNPVEGSNDDIVDDFIGKLFDPTRESFKLEDFVRHRPSSPTVKIPVTMTDQSPFDLNEYLTLMKNVQIHFVVLPNSLALRGYCGRESIYINYTYFFSKYMIINSQQNRDILCLDLITTALHEYVHELIRLKRNNLNFSTPFDSHSKEQEAGRAVELKLFKCCPNWSYIVMSKTLDMHGIRNILNCLLTNEPIIMPEIPVEYH